MPAPIIFMILAGVFAVGAAIVVTSIVLLSLKWLIDYIKKRFQQNKKHNVVFVDTKKLINDAVKNKIDTSNKISLDDLEKWSTEKPYIAADYDPETDSVSNFEAFNPEEVEEKFRRRMDNNDGVLVVSA